MSRASRSQGGASPSQGGASRSQGGASPSQGGATRSQGGANQRKIVNDEKGTFLYIDIILIIFYSII